MKKDVTIREYMTAKGLSYDKARRELNRMVKEGKATVWVRKSYESMTVPGLGRKFGGSIVMVRRTNYYTVL